MREHISASKPEPSAAKPPLAEAAARRGGEAIARSIGKPSADGSRRSAAELLQLQRLVGNQAVQRLLTEHPAPAGFVMRRPEPATPRSVSSVSTVSDPGSGAMRVILKPATGLAEILLPQGGAPKWASAVDVRQEGTGLHVFIQVTPGTRVMLNPNHPADVLIEVREVPWPVRPPGGQTLIEGSLASSPEKEDERLRDGPVLISSGPIAEEELAAPPGAVPSKPDAKPVEPSPGADPQDAAKANPYAAMTVEERADEVRKLLDKWLTGRDILRVFEACDPHDFITLQRKVDLTAVLDKLDTWDIVQLAVHGPILAPHRQKVNEERADFLVDITRKWGPERAQIFAHYMFASMAGDDVNSVLSLLAQEQHLHDTVDLMPLVGKLFGERGIDRGQIRDRGWEVLDIPRAFGRGIGGLLSSNEAERSLESFSALHMALDLPSPYREAVQETDRAAFERALTPGNVAFGTLDYMTLGLPSMVKGVTYDIPKAIISGAGAIAEGHVASGVEQLTGPAIFLVGMALGVRAFRKNARLAAMLELTEEGGALYGNLKSRIGAPGIDKVAKWVQGSAEAQILVREEGAAGIEALYRAQGDAVAARAELAASREAGLLPKPTAGGDKGLADLGERPAPGTRTETREEYQTRRSRERAEATTRAADQPLENPHPNAAQEGHGHGRHGFETTDAEQAERVRSGRFPDDPYGPLPTRTPAGRASRFSSPEAEAEALDRGRRQLDEALRSGTVTSYTDPVSGARTYVDPTTGKPVRFGCTVTTNRPGGFGTSQVPSRNPPPGNQPILDASGQRIPITSPTPLPRARVVFEYVPSTGEWRPVTYFPEPVLLPSGQLPLN